MDKKSLIAILHSIRHARDIVQTMACDNYPDTPFYDSDISRMFYELNTMCVTLSKKVKYAEATPCRTTDTTSV